MDGWWVRWDSVKSYIVRVYRNWIAGGWLVAHSKTSEWAYVFEEATRGPLRSAPHHTTGALLCVQQIYYIEFILSVVVVLKKLVAVEKRVT